MHSTTETLKELKGITFASLNVRSLYRKYDDNSILLSQSNVDLLLLQETFLNSSVSDNLLNVNNYCMIRQDRDTVNGKTAGGGLVAYIGEQYHLSHIPDWAVSNLNAKVM